MNERINEIAKQAGLKVNADGEIGPAFFGSVDAGYKKFAELIVQECCFVGEQYADGLIDSKHYDFVNKKIKEHFGVE